VRDAQAGVALSMLFGYRRSATVGDFPVPERCIPFPEMS